MPVSTAVEVVLTDDPVERKEMMAVAGFLAGYGGSTRVSYATDLRLFTAWCHEAKLTLFNVRRAHLELFGRWMEQTGRMRSTIGGEASLRTCSMPPVGRSAHRRQGEGTVESGDLPPASWPIWNDDPNWPRAYACMT